VVWLACAMAVYTKAVPVCISGVLFTGTTQLVSVQMREWTDL